jgi:alkylation response protein AidB-like acyl-CoA dehydrogenase
MDFGLTDEQRALQDALVRFLEDFSSTAAVRNMLDGNFEACKALRAGFTELGVDGITVPTEHGGLGLGLLDAALVSELLGRFVAPVDLMGNALTAIAVHRAASEPQKHKWFSRLVAGTATFGIAFMHVISQGEGGDVDHADDRLRGRSLFASCPSGVTDFLVPHRNGALWIVPKDSLGVVVRPLITIDRTRNFCILELQDAAGERLASAEDSGLVSELIASSRVLAAADALGASQRMLEMAVQYAHERKQFGAPIGSFQAVKHMCAEMAAELEPCRSLMWFAAHSLDQREVDSPVTACLAKSRLSDVSQFVARTATEVHGGIGFTEELGLHLWFKRIGLNRQLWGGPELLRAEAARRQGWHESVDDHG